MKELTFNKLRYREHPIKREPSYTVGGNVNWCSHYGKSSMEVQAKNRVAI